MSQTVGDQILRGRHADHRVGDLHQPHPPPVGPAVEISARDKLDAEADGARFDDLGRVLFDQAALAAGDGLKDPAAYVRRLNKLLLELSGA